MLLFFAAIDGSAWGQLRVVTYNTANSGENSSPSRPRDQIATVLKAIGEEDVNGIARPIDVLLLQEQSSVATTTQFIAEMMNEIHGVDTYRTGAVNAGTNGAGRPGLVYNSNSVELVDEQAFGTLSRSAQARQTMRYQLRPSGYSEQADIFAYVNHYKSGTSETDQRRRNIEAAAVRENADSLGESSNFIFAGDFNIQSCQEDMFRTLVSPGIAQAVDPLAHFGVGCNWHNNADFRLLHTQSPADTSLTGLVQGGVDDRFDFQLISQAMNNGDGVSLIPGSYHAFGNNGTHRLNQAINASNNLAAAPSVLDALARASDHLPVVADYQLPAVMHVQVDPLPTLVLQGSELDLNALVSNRAPVSHELGADSLDYTLSFTPLGFPTQSVSGSTRATNQADALSLSLPTSTLAAIVYGLDVVSSGRSVVDGTFVQAGSYNVIEPALPSFSHSEVVTETEVDLGIIAQSTAIEVPLEIHNLARAGGASLDLDSAQWEMENASWTTNLEAFADLEGKNRVQYVASPNTTVLGSIENKLALNLSDQDGVHGEREMTMALTFRATVALAGDADLDNEVGFVDFLILSENFGRDETNWSLGDFNGDATTDFVDFLSLSRNFGAIAPTPLGTVVVPEPALSGTSVLALILLASPLRRRLRGK